MKHILVPTDFSECAVHALDVALRLAKKFNASLHLYTCLKIPENWEELEETEKQKQSETLEKIASTESAFKKIREENPDLAITTSYSGGKLVKQIKKCIRKHEIDFVVMGSHGMSGVSEIFIGSNTQKVVRLIHRPLLVIKGPVADINFKQVVFASSFNLSEKKSFLKFKKLIAPFEPEIHLLGIKTSFFFDPPVSVIKSAMEDFKSLSVPFSAKIHIFKKTSIEGGIRKFAKKINADLIAISNRNRNPLKRLLTGSNVEALINHSDLPVLSIDYKKG